jgi:adenine-specific DNA-methyltransferase
MAEIEKLPLTSLDIKALQLERLKEIFPEAFTEGNKVDWDKLRLTLGAAVDTGKERYGMNWPGKSECFKTIQQPSIATLAPVREESMDFDTTQNLFIEGDNLEVLKLLQKSYLGKVKMIYIDPPYNTGNEFIYPDNYSESLDTYLAYTGQLDAGGRKFSTNTEADGRFHSKWMNMMYPRLFLAKNLLKEDGVIFISIDDSEVQNLRAICNEIFGEENFIANIVWQKKQSPQNDATYFSNMHDHIIVYVKRSKNNKNDEVGWARNLLKRSGEQTERYSNPDNDIRGNWASVDLTSNKSFEQRPNLYYPIVNPHTMEEIWPPKQRVWRYEKNTLAQLLSEDRIWWGEQRKNFPRAKRFLNEVQEGIVPSTWWTREFAGDNQAARREIRSLFNSENVDFDTPKPTQLLKKIAEIATNPLNGDIILDFFSGSSSIAHAIFEMNQFDYGNRRFILIQIPELLDEDSETYKSGYKTIADIGKERIRRVIAKINKEQTKSKTLFSEEQSQQDLGFKVFKLQKSNFTIWNTGVEKTPEAIQQQLFSHVDHISPEAEQEAILYELLLKSGFELTTAIEQLSIEGKKVYSIADGELLICLEKQLTQEVIKAIAAHKPTRVICLDAGFQDNDQLKTNAVQLMKSKGVVNFRTV